VKLFPVGKAVMLALLASSVRLNASPIACPDKVRELIHDEAGLVWLPSWGAAVLRPYKEGKNSTTPTRAGQE
jgi:hypothetical protein